MATKLKRLNEQVIVITGASSGIGLATAESAVKQGAKVVLAARSENDLDRIVQRITDAGGEAIAVKCDVANRQDVQNVADQAIQRFGHFDTWVNNAGVGIYGRLHEVSDEDNRRMFDTNFWGTVYGSFVALAHLTTHGGALINIGSEASEVYTPILGMYSASKHAVKGFTDALRVEIEQIDKSPVSITLIEPPGIDTPFDEHARNYLPNKADLPGPLLDPEEVADAILSAAVKPTRITKIGMKTKINTFAANTMPGIVDKQAAKQSKKLSRAGEPEDNAEGALHTAGGGAQTHGNHPED
jgi:short-subunit dehydrogenase